MNKRKHATYISINTFKAQRHQGDSGERNFIVNFELACLITLPFLKHRYTDWTEQRQLGTLKLRIENETFIFGF